MTTKARSHTRIRRKDGGAAWLDSRARGAFRSGRRVASMLRRMENPPEVEQTLERIGRGIEAMLAELVARQVGRAIDAFPTRLRPRTLPPAPRAAGYKGRIVILGGVAHCLVWPAGHGRFRDPGHRVECLGCGQLTTHNSVGFCVLCAPTARRTTRNVDEVVYAERTDADPWPNKLSAVVGEVVVEA